MKDTYYLVCYNKDTESYYTSYFLNSNFILNRLFKNKGIIDSIHINSFIVFILSFIYRIKINTKNYDYFIEIN